MRLPEEPTGARRTHEPRSGEPTHDRETATLM
jgi:hypothetical protein